MSHVPPLGYSDVDNGVLTWHSENLNTAASKYWGLFTPYAASP